MVAFDDGHLGIVHDMFGFTFGAHRSDRRGWWTNKLNPLLLKGIDKVSVLRQETVSWMNGFSTSSPSYIKDVIDL